VTAARLTPNRLRELQAEHGSIEAAIKWANEADPELAAQLRLSQQASANAARQVEGINEAGRQVSAALDATIASGRMLTETESWWRSTIRALDETVRDVLRRSWSAITREELRERRSARQAESRAVLSQRFEKTISERRQQLADDAALVPCPPMVLARAYLLEFQTTRSPAVNRPGSRPTAIRVEESVRVWKLHRDDSLSFRQIELSFGIPKDRAQRIFEFLEGDDALS
jgi:hypothetical protein